MLGKLTVVKGDATTPTLEIGETAIIPHVCNDAGGWGAGFVLALSKKWPGPESEYRLGYGKGQALLGTVNYVKVTENIVIANMVGQHNYQSDANPRPLKYDKLVSCMKSCARKAYNMKSGADKVSIH